MLGHNFPVWLGFRGGKGVATTLGVLLALAWPVGLLAIAVWLASAFAFRYSSLAALIALAAAPLLMLWLADGRGRCWRRCSRCSASRAITPTSAACCAARSRRSGGSGKT